MCDNFINHPHVIGILSCIGFTQEEDFTSSLLSHLSREIRRPKSSIKTCYIRICLHEEGVLLPMLVAERIVRQVGSRSLKTAVGEFEVHAFKEHTGEGVHLALVIGQWGPDDVVPARVHEPLSVLDALETGRTMHSWSLDSCLARIAQEGRGVVVLLNCGESAEQLLAQFEGRARSAQAPERGKMDLRTYGVGAQILRECGVHKMKLMGQPRRMPSMAGYGLEITGYIPKE